jgi:hypothetical protein
MEEETLFVDEMPIAADGSGRRRDVTGQMPMGLPWEMRRGMMLEFLRTLPLIKSQMITALLIACGPRSKKMAERTT